MKVIDVLWQLSRQHVNWILNYFIKFLLLIFLYIIIFDFLICMWKLLTSFDSSPDYTLTGYSAFLYCLVCCCTSVFVGELDKMSRLMTKPTKWHVRPAKTQINPVIRPVWSESSLSVWRKLGSLATHWAHSEDSDHTGRMPRLIWFFAGRTVILLVLSWGGSFNGETDRMVHIQIGWSFCSL